MNRATSAHVQPTQVPMRSAMKRDELEVAPGVICVPLSVVNAYFIAGSGTGDGQWVLVDAGMGTSAGKILQAAEEWFGKDSRPAAIVLTHGHFDHVGALRQLAEHWDVPVYAHPMEFPYLTGKSSYPPPDPFVGGGGMAIMSPLYPKSAMDISDRIRPLPHDGTVPGLPGWHWVFTPGHTPGHVSLFRESDRTLVVGDAFVTTQQESLLCALMQPQQVNGPPAYFTPDWEMAGESVRRLALLEPEVAASGHGRAMRGERLRHQLRQLADHFEEVAVPRQGRYVDNPVQVDENGVVEVPPTNVDPRLAWGLGLGLGLTAAAVVLAVVGTRRSNRAWEQATLRSPL